jgi:WD40 repeat protein
MKFAIAFSSDGTILASGIDGRTVKLWGLPGK